jgi:glycosyltransferase involved in cell wall biosynthesis
MLCPVAFLGRRVRPGRLAQYNLQIQQQLWATGHVNILFIHQNFPAQYVHLMRALAAQGGHRVVGMGINPPSDPIADGVTHLRYGIKRGNTEGIHLLAMETETKVLRGEACAQAAHELKSNGFQPDLICAHPGWGESLFLPDIWPDVPLLLYQEFFYGSYHSDLDFDAELQPPSDWWSRAKVRMKNAYLTLSLEAASWNICPTQFQRSTFPHHWQQRMSVIHDGVDTEKAAPDPAAPPLQLPDGTLLEKGQPIVTFVNRRLEPYRGCHTMIRAIPELQRRVPEARLVIVGATTGTSYGKRCEQGEWKDQFLAEIAGQYDPARVHFTGTLPYSQFLPLLRLSACHVYLTYPFVLSWSLIEAMSTACPVVGSATAPVMEVINHGKNGLLVDFFKPSDLAAAIAELLTRRDLATAFGNAARQTVLKRYELKRCLARQLGLMQAVACGDVGDLPSRLR